ncbi:diacylglycerol kinase [Helicobacter sp. MIT 03-1614]|jgi:diacylglycerol kinase (ATP)|uniref:Diacylglycerol kinase n=1 Tax=Helicobacter hepaticus (strain ATCC 51449 / 3B1) TaxID=235279 RepID=Q7VJM3_HELHP|nr:MULTISPECIES: diacylglycerol kinase [Helicobacter]AAP76817.1 diacylglycerol kinase [Helicobacter hepaticus ATCC 51449]TLD86410.1 diacylglycerol kinase [Helicobacter sp. MIT 03-1614]
MQQDKDAQSYQRNDKKGKTGIKRLYNAFFFSLDGIKAAWKEEEGFRQVLSIGIVLSIVAFFIAQTWQELILLILPCVLSVIVELINSAIENAIDFTSLEIHPLAKKAKDMGSAIQLIACLFVAFVWGSYLLNRFIF